jgi:ABC-type glycerol-3-phosphate transport system substrate-binding protein
MISLYHRRPGIPQNQLLAQELWQAMNDFYSGLKDFEQALDEAAVKLAEVLG